MPWNWQQPDWPRFSWQAPRLAMAEERFLLSDGLLLGTVRHLGDEDRDHLIPAAITTHTSAIPIINRGAFITLSGASEGDTGPICAAASAHGP